jgi:hypothetical protein
MKTLTKGETIPRGAAPFDPLAQRRMVSFQGRPVMIEAPATGLEAPAYHGTPHKWAPETLWRLTDGRTEWIIDGDPVPSGSTMVRKAPAGRVRADKVGSGEGAAAYGWGVLYAAERRGGCQGISTPIKRGRVRSSGNSPRILSSQAISWMVTAARIASSSLIPAMVIMVGVSRLKACLSRTGSG